ncbi:hypothetical protein [Microbaculum marinum]|uniref:Uncharacterized protein n=1 Tax=Microbaculum marinum TaxID=1764581 RepID=A0AAW9RQN8_9HYPH
MGKRKKPAQPRRILILGGAACVHADAAAARALCEFDAVMACNTIIADWPEPIDYAVTLHPDKIEAWYAQRLERQPDTPPELWVHFRRVHKPIRYAHKTTAEIGGTVGLYAVKVARELGFERIVLAGVPIDPEMQHYTGVEPWAGRGADRAELYRIVWRSKLPELRPFVRSMSGWTAERLGMPDPVWLGLEPAPTDEEILGPERVAAIAKMKRGMRTVRKAIEAAMPADDLSALDALHAHYLTAAEHLMRRQVPKP